MRETINIKHTTNARPVWKGLASRCMPGADADPAGHARRRLISLQKWPQMLMDHGVYVIGFSFPGRAARARRESAFRFRPPTRRSRSTGRSRRLRRSAGNSGSCQGVMKKTRPSKRGAGVLIPGNAGGYSSDCGSCENVARRVRVCEMPRVISTSLTSSCCKGGVPVIDGNRMGRLFR